MVVNKINKKVSELTVDDIAMYCEEAGITVYTLCRNLKILETASIPKFDRDGEEIAQIPDNNVRLKVLMVEAEMLKLIARKELIGTSVVQHQMAPGDIDRLEVIAKELKGLESRLVVDKVQQGIIDV